MVGVWLKMVGLLFMFEMLCRLWCFVIGFLNVVWFRFMVVLFCLSGFIEMVGKEILLDFEMLRCIE